MIILLIVGLIKKIYYKMNGKYFPAYFTARNKIEGKKYLEEDSFLYFDRAIKYVTTYKTPDNISYVTSWQSKGQPDMNITAPIS